jgi:hypothetical protein
VDAQVDAGTPCADHGNDVIENKLAIAQIRVNASIDLPRSRQMAEQERLNVWPAEADDGDGRCAWRREQHRSRAH